MRTLLFCSSILIILSLVNISNQRKSKLNRWTKSSTGCPCWWDLTRGDVCACCNSSGVQCGYPKHQRCMDKKRYSRIGCPGVKWKKWTLSEKGYPCYTSPERGNDCAWCKAGGYQCGEDHRLGCVGEQHVPKHCDGIVGDCRHIPTACDPNASCKPGKRSGKITWHSCVCNQGFTGNGIQCYDSDGNLSPNPNQEVEMEVSMKSEFYVHPHEEGVFNDTANIQHIKESFENAKDFCDGYSYCSASLKP